MVRCKAVLSATAAVALALAVLGNVQAAMVSESFFLDQSNGLPDGVNYGIVTLTADDVAGTVKFDVTAPYVYSGSAASSYGFDKFYFNTSADVGNNFLVTVPDGTDWRLDDKRDAFNVSEFGWYDFELSAKQGNDPLSMFSFTVQLNEGFESYATVDHFANLDGAGPDGSSRDFFAGHVKGFAESHGATSHFTTGSTPVPEPSAIVLWGLCGVLVLFWGRRFRR